MIAQEVVNMLRERYSQLHPLIFLRSVEHAKDAGELFEILEGFPDHYPVVWDEQERCWTKCDLIKFDEINQTRQ